MLLAPTQLGSQTSSFHTGRPLGPNPRPAQRQTHRSVVEASLGGQGLARFDNGVGSVSFRAPNNINTEPSLTSAKQPQQKAISGKAGGVAFSGAGRQGLATFHSPFSPTPTKAGTLQKLKAFGVAGVISYGLLNTLYYTLAFLFIWVNVAKVPRGLGVQAAATEFVKVFGLTWAGSQVTKVPRAGIALALAPIVDRGLDALQNVLHLKTKRDAFLLIVKGCLGLAAVLFGVVVLAWA